MITSAQKLLMARAGVPSAAGWDLSNASYSQSFSVVTNADNPRAVFFKPDGAKMYIASDVNDAVVEYDLSTSWDISTASYLQNFSIASQDVNSRGLSFKSDGTKMYFLGSSNDRVSEYNLSTAWDVSTASYSQNFSIASQDGNPTSLFFKPDGTKFYITGNDNNSVFEYDLSTAWDVSTASYLQSFSVSSQDITPQGNFFKTDGTKMFVVGNTNDAVFEYDLSTAWDVSTASYSQSFSLSSQDTDVRGLFFKPDDGTKMYMSGNGNDTVYEYDL